MENTVLLVVDIQNALVEANPFNEATVLKNVEKLISAAREKNIEVIYVRHDGGVGDELEKGTIGWEIYNDISPMPSEKVIDKSFCSAFMKTGLREYLDSKGINIIILVGMQTEYCIDVTCKAAFEYGYKVIIPQSTTTTYDNDVLTGKELTNYYEQKIWHNRFATVAPLDHVLGRV